jgi:hypothetical protein
MLGGLLWLSFAPGILGQQGGRTVRAATGVVRLGPDQILRLTVNGQAGNDTLIVTFRRTYYQGSANGGVWKCSIVAQDVSNPISLGPAEAQGTDISQTVDMFAVSGEVTIRGYTGTTTVNNGVLFQIIKASTGEVVSAWKDADIAH